MDTEAFTARGRLPASRSERKTDSQRQNAGPESGHDRVRFRKGRVDVRPQAKVIQSWWRAITVERRTRGLEAFLGWLAKKREVREIEVQFAACTIQAFGPTVPHRCLIPEKRVCRGRSGVRGTRNGRLSKTWFSREQYQLHMQEWRDDRRRLEAVQARLKALGKGARSSVPRVLDHCPAQGPCPPSSKEVPRCAAKPGDAVQVLPGGEPLRAPPLGDGVGRRRFGRVLVSMAGGTLKFCIKLSLYHILIHCLTERFGDGG